MASSKTFEGEIEENQKSKESKEVETPASYSSLLLQTSYGGLPELIRLLVAQGLVQEKEGRIMEDVAEENLYELINQGMLQLKKRHFCPGGTRFQVPSPVREFCVRQMEEGNFEALRVFICSDITKIISYMNNHHVSSLFLLGKNLSQHEGNWVQFNVWYKHFDIRFCGRLTALLAEILNLVILRHIKMYKNMFRDVHGVKLPVGIGCWGLKRLHYFGDVYSGGGSAEELGNLIQLRKLEVMDVAEENINELLASITKMSEILSLEILSSQIHSPPPFLQKFCLEGIRGKLPTWFGSSERLTNLTLGNSHMSDDSSLVFQLLPNFENLSLRNAYDAKRIGTEFCSAGGFPKLQVLTMASRVLEEWTEIEEGALPSLKYLCIRNCLRLRMLPQVCSFSPNLSCCICCLCQRILENGSNPIWQRGQLQN
ncbi:unnamed protein product [Malus baccata var. baccata]